MVLIMKVTKEQSAVNRQALVDAASRLYRERGVNPVRQRAHHDGSVMLVERGIPIIEMLNLEELAARQGMLSDFVLSPLALLGATGSPVRPLALLEARS